MPLAAANLIANGTAGGSGPYTTASITPTGNALVLVTIHNSTGAGTTANVPTVDGSACGLTFVQVATVPAGTNNNLTMFRGMAASPSSGTLSIDVGGQAQTVIDWTVSQFTGADTTGTSGSGAVVQSAANAVFAASLTVTLAAFGSANNAGYGAFAQSSKSTITAGSGFTKLSQFINPDTLGWTTADEWKLNSTAVSVSIGASHSISGIAVEVKAAPPSGALFRRAEGLSGLGTGGPFFKDPLAFSIAKLKRSLERIPRPEMALLIP